MKQPLLRGQSPKREKDCLRSGRFCGQSFSCGPLVKELHLEGLHLKNFRKADVISRIG